MNRIYKSIYSAAVGAVVAVSEAARSRGERQSGGASVALLPFDIVGAFALLGAFLIAGLALVALGALFAKLGVVAALMGGALKGRGYIERPNLITNAALNNGGQTQFSKEFPMGEGWNQLLLRFNETVVIGTGTTPVTESELLYIKNVLLRTDRSEIICNLPGRALYKIATYRLGTPPRKDAMAASSATYRVTLPILFTDDFMLRPEDTILDTKRYNSVSMIVTLGTVADLFGTPGSATVTTTLDVDVERSMGKLPQEAEPLFHANYDYRQPVDASVTTSVELEKSGDMSIKRLFVHSGTTGTAGVPWSGANADTVQNTANVKDQNRFIEKDRIHAAILDLNKMDSALEATLSGIEVFDFVRDKSILSSLATGDKSLLQYQWTNQGGVGALSIVTVTQEGVRTLK